MQLHNIMKYFGRYMYSTKMLYGDIGEILVEELLLNGQCETLALIKKVVDRLKQSFEQGK